jgi:hypothetical protein
MSGSILASQKAATFHEFVDTLEDTKLELRGRPVIASKVFRKQVSEVCQGQLLHPHAVDGHR